MADNYYSALGLNIANNDGSDYSKAAGATLDSAGNTLYNILNAKNTAFTAARQAANDMGSILGNAPEYNEKGQLIKSGSGLMSLPQYMVDKNLEREADKEIATNRDIARNTIKDKAQGEINRELASLNYNSLQDFENNLKSVVAGEFQSTGSSLSSSEIMYYLQNPEALTTNQKNLTVTDYKNLESLSKNYEFRKEMDKFLELSYKQHNLDNNWFTEQQLYEEAGLLKELTPKATYNYSTNDIYTALLADQRNARNQPKDKTDAQFLSTNAMDRNSLEHILVSKGVLAQKEQTPKPLTDRGTPIKTTLKTTNNEPSKNEYPYLYSDNAKEVKDKYGIENVPLFDVETGKLTEYGQNIYREAQLRDMDLKDKEVGVQQIIEDDRASVFTKRTSLYYGETLLGGVGFKSAKLVGAKGLKYIAEGANRKTIALAQKVSKNVNATSITPDMLTLINKAASGKDPSAISKLQQSKEFDNIVTEMEKELDKTKEGKTLKTKIRNTAKSMLDKDSKLTKYSNRTIFGLALIGGVTYLSSTSELDLLSGINNFLTQDNASNSFYNDLSSLYPQQKDGWIRTKTSTTAKESLDLLPGGNSQMSEEWRQKIRNWDFDEIEKARDFNTTILPVSKEDFNKLIEYGKELQKQVRIVDRFRDEQAKNTLQSKERTQILPLESIKKEVKQVKIGSKDADAVSPVLKIGLPTKISESVNQNVLGQTNTIGSNTNENTLGSEGLALNMISNLIGVDSSKLPVRLENTNMIINSSYKGNSIEKGIIDILKNDKALTLLAHSIMPNLDLSSESSLGFLTSVLQDNIVKDILTEIKAKGTFNPKDSKLETLEEELTDRIVKIAGEMTVKPLTKDYKYMNNANLGYILNNEQTNKQIKNLGIVKKIYKGYYTKFGNFDEAYEYFRNNR